MSDCKQANKIKEKWSMIAQLSFEMEEDDDFKSNPSTKEGSEITEEKIDKILDWLQRNGAKEGTPASIIEAGQDLCKQRILLKQELLRG